jgi:hypothetical protein
MLLSKLALAASWASPSATPYRHPSVPCLDRKGRTNPIRFETMSCLRMLHAVDALECTILLHDQCKTCWAALAAVCS